MNKPTSYNFTDSQLNYLKEALSNQANNTRNKGHNLVIKRLIKKLERKAG